MREIKYMAYLKESNEVMPVLSIDFEDGVIYVGDTWMAFDEVEFMQYTGLKDKNGNEIYEGDIIKGNAAGCFDITAGDVAFMGCDYVVNVSEGSARGFYYLHHILCDTMEVIGNIYQNKELLSCETEAK